MHAIHNCVLSVGISIIVLIHTLRSVALLKSYLAWEFQSTAFGAESMVEKRLTSRLRWKILLDVLGSVISVLFWAAALVIRIIPKDLSRTAYKLYYLISTAIWQTLVLPYILISFIHSIYLVFVLTDDAGFTHGEVANKLFDSFTGLSSELADKDKVNLINSLELMQRKYACCGGKSYTDWLQIDVLSSVTTKETGSSDLDIEPVEIDPWGQKYTTGFFPTSCCDRNRTITCASSLLTPSKELTIYYLSYEAPVYRSDCVSAVYHHIYTELSGLILLFALVDIVLHFIQLYAQSKSYYISAPRYPCVKWAHMLPPLQSLLTPPKLGSRRESTGSMTHRTGSITHMDGSRTHRDGSVLLPDGTVLPRPEKLMHRSGSITHRSGSRTHRTGSQTHVDGSRTHRTGSITRPDGSRLHRDKSITPGPGDSREVCMLGDRVKVFFGSTGYISTERLLSACQGFHLYAQPSLAQQSTMDVKSDWLENIMKIGWMLRGAGKQYACFLPRIPMKRNRGLTPAQTSEWRRFLRLHMPIIEAILFADGNAVLESEANSFYRSFVVAFIRGLLFLLLGFVAASVIVPCCLSINLNSPILNTCRDRPNNEALQAELDEKVREHVAVIHQEVVRQSTLFLYITIMIGTLVSRRVRCLLLLIIPVFGLRFGFVHLTNQMLHAVLIGPLANSEQNLLATSGMIGCLAEMSHNVTRDFERVNWLDSTDDDVSAQYADVLGSKSPDYRAPSPHFLGLVNETSKNIINAFDQYIALWPPIEQLDVVYDKLGEFSSKQYSTASDDLKEFRTAADNMIRDLDKYIDVKRKLFETEIKNLTAESNLPENFMKTIRFRLDKGAVLEKKMNRYVALVCFRYKQYNLTTCREQSSGVCSVLQSVIKSLNYQPVWYSQACDQQANYEYACPYSTFLREANLECGLVPNSLGMENGLGAYGLEAQQSLAALQGAFKIDVSYHEEEIEFKNDSKWLQSVGDGTTRQQNMMTDGITGLFYSLVILSTLARLTILGVFYNAHSYISNYLTDTNFDNIYAGNMFEFIDAKRLREGRETLLPLKSMESPHIYWRRKCYTSNEVQRLITQLILALLVGFGLLIIFAVDTHIYELVIFLVDLTAGYHGMRVRIRDTYFSGTHATVVGDGVFHEVLNKLLRNLGRLRDLNLNYDTIYCSPVAFQTSTTHATDFYSSWYLLIALVIFAPALLRIRHVVAGFFYPSRTRNRTVALYNSLLIKRRRHMTMCRNLVVHWVREGRLQQEARIQSEPNLITALLPKVATFLGLDKKTCIICQDRIPAGPEISVCTLDRAAVCRQCVAVVLKKDFCVVCLDRNPKRLFKERRKIQRLENRLSVKMYEG